MMQKVIREGGVRKAFIISALSNMHGAPKAALHVWTHEPGLEVSLLTTPGRFQKVETPKSPDAWRLQPVCGRNQLLRASSESRGKRERQRNLRERLGNFSQSQGSHQQHVMVCYMTHGSTLNKDHINNNDKKEETKHCFDWISETH